MMTYLNLKSNFKTGNKSQFNMNQNIHIDPKKLTTNQHKINKIKLKYRGVNVGE